MLTIMKSHKHAFSLTELMVVIAIIAILAAIGVPAYRNYILNAKFQAATSAMSSILEKAKIHMDTKGDIDINALGLSTYTGSTSGDGFTSLSGFPIADPPNGTDSAFVYLVPSPFFTCHKPGIVSEIVVGIDKYIMGISDTPGSIGLAVYFVYKQNGVYETSCVNYTLSPSVISGCPGDWGTVTSAATAACQ